MFPYESDILTATEREARFQENLRRVSRCYYRDSNWYTPENKSESLVLKPSCSEL